MLRELITRWRRDPYDAAYHRNRHRRIERERRHAEQLQAFRVFLHEDAEVTTSTLPQMRLE